MRIENLYMFFKNMISKQYKYTYIYKYKQRILNVCYLNGMI